MIRENKISDEEVHRLNEQCYDQKSDDSSAIKIAPKNDIADLINSKSLAECSRKRFTYIGDVTGIYAKGERCSPEKLELCEGARLCLPKMTSQENGQRKFRDSFGDR